MLRTSIIILLFLSGLADAAFSQQLVSATLLGSKTKAELIAQLGVPFIQYDVKFYKITYTTPDVNGVTDTVSGLLAAPVAPDKVFPRLVYQHGTSGSKQDVPSNLNDDGDEGNIALFFAGMGFVSLAPDYLGLGVSKGFHPYVHAATEASVALDMLRATQSFAPQNHLINTNTQLFVTGYSQGGHGAMALHREIETNLAGEFTVTAAAPLSGPYSISGVMRDLILSNKVYYYPAYLANTTLSYQTVYGNLFTQLTDIFKPAYAALIAPFYSGSSNLSDLNTQLIDALIANEGACIPTKMLKDSIIQIVTNNPVHPINLALADNDVHRWKAKAPTRLFYCMNDDQVPFANSLIARDTMTAYGAADLVATDVKPDANHTGCVVPALTSTLFFFLGYQTIFTLTSAEEANVLRLELHPNPANSYFMLHDLPAEGRLRISDFSGRLRDEADVARGDQQIDVSGLDNGMYLVRLVAEGKTWQSQLFIWH